jgi:iron complex transport system permease protein
VVALTALTAGAVTALCLGSPVLSPVAALRSIGEPDGLEHLWVWELRAPRAAIGATCGAAFGLAGLLLQRSLGNPLAVPELLGVSGGAACAVAVLVVTGAGVGSAWFPPLAIAGGLAGGVLTVLAAEGAPSATRVVLVGSAVSAALAAITVSVAASADRLQLQALLRYLSGSLVGLYWDDAVVVLPWVLGAGALACLVVPATRLLALGDDASRAAGLHPGRTRLAVLVVAAVLVAVPTAFVGPVAWVGFAAPQVLRMLGSDLSAGTEAVAVCAAGGVVVLAADLASRTAFAPVETPLGAWTALAALLLAAVVLVARGRAGTGRVAS